MGQDEHETAPREYQTSEKVVLSRRLWTAYPGEHDTAFPVYPHPSNLLGSCARSLHLFSVTTHHDQIFVAVDPSELRSGWGTETGAVGTYKGD